MGHSKAEKAKSHDRVVRVAAARFRETGVDGVGVADLMRDAGLTHGAIQRSSQLCAVARDPVAARSGN